MSRELIISGTRYLYQQEDQSFVQYGNPQNKLLISDMKQDNHLLTFELDPINASIYNPAENSGQLPQVISIPTQLLHERDWENNIIVNRLNTMMFNDQWDVRVVDEIMRQRLNGHLPTVMVGEDRLKLDMVQLAFFVEAMKQKGGSITDKVIGDKILPLTLPYIGTTERMEMTFLYDPERKQMAFPGPDSLQSSPKAVHVKLGHPMKMDPVGWSEIFLNKPEGLLNHYLVQPELKATVTPVTEEIRLQMLKEMRNRLNSPLQDMINKVKENTKRHQRNRLPLKK